MYNLISYILVGEQGLIIPSEFFKFSTREMFKFDESIISNFEEKNIPENGKIKKNYWFYGCSL